MSESQLENVIMQWATLLVLLGVGACKQADHNAAQLPPRVVGNSPADSIHVSAAASVTAAGAVERDGVGADPSPIAGPTNSVEASISKDAATRAVATPMANTGAVNQKRSKHCKVGKIAFDQGHACANDGSNEFCVADNTETHAAVRAIFPGVRCMRGGGRANCLEAPGQLLCFIDNGQCTTSHGGTDDTYWLRICDLSLLPQVNHITHTIYE
jgi:hypothetical protein